MWVSADPGVRSSVDRIRWLGLAGVAALLAPLLMWVEFFVMGSLRPGYNLVTGAASELAARGTTHAAVFSAGFFFLPGVLTLFVATGLWRTGRGGHLWRTGALLVAVAGALLVLTGVFPLDRTSALSSGLHGIVSQACFAIVTVAMLLMSAGASRIQWEGVPRRLWLGLGFGLTAVELFNLTFRQAMALPNGLFQRPFMILVTVWFVVTGVWLLRADAYREWAGTYGASSV